MRRIKRSYIIAAFVASLLVSNIANADSYFSGNTADHSNSSSGGQIKLNGNWAYRSGYVAWYKYVLNDTAATATLKTTSLPFDNYVRSNIGESGSVAGEMAKFDSECLKWSKSIYISGNVLFIQEDSPQGYLKMFNGQKDGTNYNNAFHGLYINVRYNSDISKYVNANVYLGRAGTGTDDTTNHKYYRLIVGEDIPDYVDHVEVVPYSEAANAWDKAKQFSTDSAIKNSSLSDSKYTVFCGGEKADSYGNYKGDAKIEVNYDGNNDDNFGSPDVVAATDGTSSRTVEITTGSNTRTIKYKAFGNTEFDNSAAVPSGYTNKYTGTAYYVYRGEDGSLAPTSLLYKTVTTGYAGDDAILTLSIEPGETKTVCAINQYFKTYRSKDANPWHDATNSAKACVTVKYNSTAYNMGTASQIVVLQNGVRKANAFNIDQNSKNTSTGDRFGNGTSTTGSINNSFGQPSSVTVSSGIEPGNIEVFALNKVTKLSKEPQDAPDADIKLTGLTIQNPSNNSNACNNATLRSTIYYKDCYNAGDTTKIIYPEQTVTYTATTSVPSQIKASGEVSGTKVTTSASVTVTADPLTCPDFNNAQIGVNHATNYGRLMLGDDGAISEANKLSVGNLSDGGWRDTLDLYFAPWNKTSKSQYLSYYACMGYQAKIDASGGTDNTTYTVSSNRESVIANLNMYKTKTPASYISIRSTQAKAAGKNITAWEIGNDGITRIKNKYSSGKQTTNPFNLDKNFVGYKTSNTFAWNNSSFGDSRTVSIDINVPYNYYLDDNSDFKSDEKVIYAGESPRFAINTKPYGRTNEKVSKTSGYGDTYATTQLRTTIRSVTPIYIKSGVSVDQIRALQKMVIPDNVTNNVYNVLRANGLDADPGKFSDGSPIKTDSFNAETDDKGDSSVIGIKNYPCSKDNGSDCVEFEAVKDGDNIGDKLCVAVAVYPADSHNIIAVTDKDGGKVVDARGIIESDDQSSALNGPDYKNGGEKTLISLSCATVGKKPSMSVEGGSLMTKGAIAANNTTYGGHIFGSWAEYDIVSGYSTKGIIGSGAAFAYANPQATINASRTDGDGLEGGKLKKPQSIGNTASNDYYGDDAEAAAQVARGEGTTSSAWQFANNIYQKYIADSSASHPDLIKTVVSDGTNASDILAGADQEGKLYMVHSDGKLRIDSNIENHLNNTIYVIYSEAGIDIAPSVTRIDAFLIANKNGTASSSTTGTATIDTCAGYDRDDIHGNQVLLENCNKTLVINGAVAAEKIVLDRAAGGGSYEDSEELKPDSLTQRAEIFNYDMRAVFWATKMLDNEDVTNSTYVKELSPRL